MMVKEEDLNRPSFQRPNSPTAYKRVKHPNFRDALGHTEHVQYYIQDGMSRFTKNIVGGHSLHLLYETYHAFPHLNELIASFFTI